MRRFIITSPKFTGSVELIYNSDGMLDGIDFSKLPSNPFNRNRFKEVIPIALANLETAFKETLCTIVEAAFEITFDMFWSRYNKKINKSRCLPLWDKLNKTEQVKAWQGIEGYEAFLKATPWRTKCDPETYIRNKMWENEWK